MIINEDLWNNFINKSVDDLYEFHSLSDDEKSAVIIYELYSQSASGDGWEYFFDHMKYENISNDFIKDVIDKYFDDKMLENFNEAKELYEEQGFDGNYDEVNTPLMDKESAIEEIILNFIENHKDLYV